MIEDQLILGIAPQHTSSVCVLDRHGKLLFAASEERFNRIKCYSSVPLRALEHVARHFDVKKIKTVAIAGGHQFRKIDFMTPEEQEKCLRNPFNVRRFLSNQDGVAEWQNLLGRLGIDATLHWYDHHECHTASAYYASGMERALVVTLDGGGDGLSATVAHADHGEIKRVAAFDEKVSAGFFYGAVTAGLGFRIFRHEGKLTGLAAYGDRNKLYQRLRDLFAVDIDNNRLSIRAKLVENMFTASWPADQLFQAGTYFKFLRGGLTMQQMKDRLNNYKPRQAFEKYFKGETYTREDMAAAAQAVLEDNAIALVRHYLEQTDYDCLALAGGVVANVKMNQYLFNIDRVKRIFVAPYMGDEGLCVGAAYLELKRLDPAFRGRRIDTMYLGPAYDAKQVETALQKLGVRHFERIDDIDARARRIAELLAEDKVVGLFSGGMEFGPRALGARSVLAPAKQYGINDSLNKRMNRSEFMPFAPVMQHEKAHEVLEGKISGSEFAAEFMTITYRVKEKYREMAPAVVHVDGTARPQLVQEDKHPLYYHILGHYERLTGIPILVNTSFNMHEEPIVHTPEDAIKSFQINCVDVLAIENFVVTR